MRRIDARPVVRGKPCSGNAQRMAEEDLSFTFCFDVIGKPCGGFVEQAGNAKIHACTANVSSAIAASNSA